MIGEPNGNVLTLAMYINVDSMFDDVADIWRHMDVSIKYLY